MCLCPYICKLDFTECGAIGSFAGTFWNVNPTNEVGEWLRNLCVTFYQVSEISGNVGKSTAAP